MTFLTRLREGRSRHGLRRYVGRFARRQVDRAFYRLDRKTLVKRFRDLGLRGGATVCVHAALSRLGYIDGHADAVIDALLEAVGPDGTVMMPTFPTRGAAVDYVRSGQVFDVRSTPSRVGFLTEQFRRRPGVLRSLHPTNPVAAFGPRASALLLDHERSLTPFGPETPYARLAALDEGYVLMLDTHIHSLLHYVQDRVGLPKLFLPGEYDAPVVGQDGVARTVRTRLMRPRVSYMIAVPSPREGVPDWAILHDFALVYPPSRDKKIRRAGYVFDGYEKIWQRRDELERAGCLRQERVGRGYVGLLHARKFVEYLEPEFRQLIDRFNHCYDPEAIAARRLPFV